MIPKHIIQLFDLIGHSGEASIGYRVISKDACLDTDSDYLLRSLKETLAHIGQEVPHDDTEGVYPWPL